MKIFLSYARPDRDFAKEIVENLRETPHQVWFDEEHIGPGGSWAKQIEGALTSSKAMIVLVSPASMNSKEVRREIDHALLSKNFAHRVLPVYVEPTQDVPWFLHSLQGVSVGADRAKAIRKISSVLDSFDEQMKTTAEDKT
jgi:TIR domain